MNRAELAAIEAGVERHLASVETLIPPRPAWRATGDRDIRPAAVHVVAGGALRHEGRGDRRLGILVAVGAVIVVTLAYGLAGGGGLHIQSPSGSPSGPSTSASTAPSESGLLRPVVEPRLMIPVRPTTTWTVVDDGARYLNLVHFLDAVGSSGYSVGVSVFEPVGVYDPVVETRRLALPTDLVGWIQAHPDLESRARAELTIGGLPATTIDATVTYRAGGPKGQTAQFIDDGVGSWNLEFPSRKRFVLVELPDRPLLIVFDSRPEFFDAGIGHFEDLLRSIVFALR